MALLEFQAGDFIIGLLLSTACGGREDSSEVGAAFYSDSSQLLSVSTEITKLRLKPTLI